MGYVEENLLKDEIIAFRGRLHWIVLFWPVAVAVPFGLFGLSTTLMGVAGSSTGVAGTGVALLLVGCLSIGLGIGRIKSAEFAVTNKRVILKYGLVQRRTAEMFLQKIESVGVDQGVLGRILNYGTVTVRGSGGTLEPFGNVAHPLEFRREVQERVSQLPGMEARTAAV
jgi:uncharacterized membrane protein YdbT with pleckstrin-like domain